MIMSSPRYKFHSHKEVQKMNFRLVTLPRVAVMCISIFLTIGVGAAFGGTVKMQDQEKGKASTDEMKISDGEKKAIDKINTASGAEAKMKAANEYMKKNAKSQMRPRVASYVAGEIFLVQDNNQKISLSKEYLSVFNDVTEADMIRPALIEAYLNSKKFDEALSESSKHLARQPDDVAILTQLAWAGTVQTQLQAASSSLQQAALTSAARAVELMEGDKKPEKMTPENWTAYRNSWLPKLYQGQGLIYFYTNDKAKARENLEKSAGFDPYEPSVLLLLSDIANGEYQDIAQRYQAEKKADLLNQALAKMDETIDWLARAAAASEGNPQLQGMNQQVMENLKAYYSFRHEGKMDGLTELIQKYKKPQK